MCQFSSLDVQDIMGTERQGITKNILMQRIDSHGRAIEVKYTGDGIAHHLRASQCGARFALEAPRGGGAAGRPCGERGASHS